MPSGVQSGPPISRPPCVHDSRRLDGYLDSRDVEPLVEAARIAVKELDYAPPGESERDSSFRIKTKWKLQGALAPFDQAENSGNCLSANEMPGDAIPNCSPTDLSNCPTCGSTVRTVSGDEGASHFEPVHEVGPEDLLSFGAGTGIGDGKLTMPDLRPSQIKTLRLVASFPDEQVIASDVAHRFDISIRSAEGRLARLEAQGLLANTQLSWLNEHLIFVHRLTQQGREALEAEGG